MTININTEALNVVAMTETPQKVTISISPAQEVKACWIMAHAVATQEGGAPFEIARRTGSYYQNLTLAQLVAML